VYAAEVVVVFPVNAVMKQLAVASTKVAGVMRENLSVEASTAAVGRFLRNMLNF
jgi:hypothetical protein